MPRAGMHIQAEQLDDAQKRRCRNSRLAMSGDLTTYSFFRSVTVCELAADGAHFAWAWVGVDASAFVPGLIPRLWPPFCQPLVFQRFAAAWVRGPWVATWQ